MPHSGRRSSPATVALPWIALALACKGAGTPAEPPAIVLTPRLAAVAAGDTGGIALEAVARDGGAVTWALVPDGLGTLAVEGNRASYVPPSVLDGARSAFVEATRGEHRLRAEIAVLPVAVRPRGAVALAGAGPVRFQAVLPVDGVVTWALDPPDAGTLTASGTQAEYLPPSGGGSRAARILADAGAAGGHAAANVTIAGTGGITVSGVVRIGDGVPPVEGAVVRIGSTTVTTDVSGTFTIPGVVPPYDLVVVRSGAVGAHVWLGLTRPDLDVLSLAAGDTWTGVQTVLVTGTFVGAVDAPHVFTEANASRSTSWTAQGPTGFGGYVFYHPDATTDLTIRGLQWREGADGAPAEYLSYGSRPVALRGALSGIEVPLDVPVPGWHARGTVAWDRDVYGTAAPHVDVVLEFADGSLRPSHGATVAQGRFDAVVPAIATGRAALTASATSPSLLVPPWFDGQSAYVLQPVEPGAQDVVVRMPGRTTLVAPVGGGTIPDALPTFQWTAPEGGHSRIDLQCFSGGYGVGEWFVHTAGSTAAFPDLRDLGVGLPAGKSCSWTLSWESTSLDEAAAPPDQRSEIMGFPRASTFAKFGRFALPAP